MNSGAERLTTRYCQRERPTDRHTDRQADIDRQMQKETDKETQRDRHTGQTGPGTASSHVWSLPLIAPRKAAHIG